MKEIVNDGFIGGSKKGSKKANLSWTTKGYGKKGGANSASSAMSKPALKKDLIKTTLDQVSNLGDFALNARKYARDIANSAQAGRPWDMADTTGTNTLLGRTPIEVLEADVAPQGYTGNPMSSMSSSQAARLAQLRANNMLSRPPSRPGQSTLEDAAEQALEDDAIEDAPETLAEDIGLGKKKKKSTKRGVKRTTKVVSLGSGKRKSSKKRKSLANKKGAGFLSDLEEAFKWVAPEIYYPIKAIYNAANNNSSPASAPQPSTAPSIPTRRGPSTINPGIAGGRRLGGAPKKEKNDLEKTLENENRILKDARRRYTNELSESVKDYRQQLMDEHRDLDFKDETHRKTLNAHVAEFKKKIENNMKIQLAVASANAYQEGYNYVRSTRVHYTGARTGYGKKKRSSSKKVTKRSSSKKKKASAKKVKKVKKASKRNPRKRKSTKKLSRK